VSALPTRRSEAWKYSDLSAALGGVAPPMVGEGDVIERLAEGADRASALEVAAGERRVIFDVLDADNFAASSTRVRIGAGALLERIAFQKGGGVLLSRYEVTLAAGGAFSQVVIAEGAKLARIETHVNVEGEGAEVELNGLYLCAGGRHADLTSVVTHKAEGSQTRQLIKGVARKGGRGVFQGKIVVKPGAQRTDARQHHQGMLLEDGAEIFAKPELMIHADDVACAHGNTAGGLDANALFYLRARGVTESEARALLTEAFLLEAVPDWVAGDVRTEIEARIGAWLRGAP
jgi:Fe-S cluster assembly protein SufD